MHVGLLHRHAQPKSYLGLDKRSREPDFHGQGWSATPQGSKQQGLRFSEFLILEPKDWWCWGMKDAGN